MEKHPPEIFDHAGALFASRLPGMGCQPPEIALRFAKGKGFQNDRPSRDIFRDKRKGTEAGNQHDPVPLPVAPDLLRLGHGADIFSRGLRFDHAPGWKLVEERVCILFRVSGSPSELVGREQPPVGQPGTSVLDVDDTPDFRRQGLADIVQQPFQCRVERGLRHMGSRGPNVRKLGQVSLYEVGRGIFHVTAVFLPGIGGSRKGSQANSALFCRLISRVTATAVERG